MLNAFTVDLEDWFCVSNMEGVIHRDEWDGQERRIEPATAKILGLLRDRSVRATFFVLGWIAERFPALVARISDEGHEIGVHGYDHRKVADLGREGFADDLQRAVAAISKIVPREKILGYRAPSFSISPDTAWALDVVRSLGFSYDSSINPVSGHPDYGWPGFPCHVQTMPGGLIEVPMTPGLGGGYFRMLPYFASKVIVRRANDGGLPVVFYMHPWEVDPAQPRVALPIVKRFRHYINLEGTMGKLSRLLADFRFGAIGDVLMEREN